MLQQFEVDQHLKKSGMTVKALYSLVKSLFTRRAQLSRISLCNGNLLILVKLTKTQNSSIVFNLHSLSIEKSHKINVSSPHGHVAAINNNRLQVTFWFSGVLQR